MSGGVLEGAMNSTKRPAKLIVSYSPFIEALTEEEKEKLAKIKKKMKKKVKKSKAVIKGQVSWLCW